MEKFSEKRRAFVLASAGAMAGILQAKAAFSQLVNAAERPDPKTFESGDFVWPKPPGAFIPYEGVPPERLLVDAQEVTESEWTRLKFEFIRAARAADPGVDPAERQYRLDIADRLETMSYSTFFNDYSAGVSPKEFQTYGAGQIAYVGHVAILEVDPASKIPYVIEAVYGQTLECKSCVQRVSYERWLSARGNVLVWHGRLKGVGAAQRAQVAALAGVEQGKPYRFFNWNLMDTSGFYCSKLVWYAVMKATGIALDDNPDPRRPIWFSPLQAMKYGKEKNHIDLLSSPGNYRNI